MKLARKSPKCLEINEQHIHFPETGGVVAEILIERGIPWERSILLVTSAIACSVATGAGGSTGGLKTLVR